jgi:hypothetical protein
MDCSKNYSTLIPYLSSVAKKIWSSSTAGDKENQENEREEFSLSTSSSFLEAENWNSQDGSFDIENSDFSFITQQKEIEDSITNKIATEDGANLNGGEFFDVHNVDVAFVNQQKWIEKQIQSKSPVQQETRSQGLYPNWPNASNSQFVLGSSEKQARRMKPFQKSSTSQITNKPPSSQPTTTKTDSNFQSRITSFFFRQT